MSLSTEQVNPYDEVPYVSYALQETSPAFMRSCAALFAVEAPDPRKARILELGCAGGNNIIAIAATYPGSECVGIDLSQVQIDEGQKVVDAVGIKNLKLQKRSIADINEADGKFDYIIAHGVISWVPKDMQQKILDICNKNLSENGIAYISYNTLPGWSTSNAIREMMKFHTDGFTDPAMRASQARELLQFIKNSHKGFEKNLYSQIIEHEVSTLAKESDWYLLHDYLEDNNTQFYFHQFIEMTRSHNLQYLCETHLSTMTTKHFPEEIAKTLAGTGNIIRMEQYIDFITNRRFRSTLLCHREISVKRNILQERIEDKFFTSRFRIPEELKTYDYNSAKPLVFKLPNNLSTTTSNIVMILAFEVLGEQKSKPVNLEKLTSLILDKMKKHKVKEQYNEQSVRQILMLNLLGSIFAGGIYLHMDEGNFITKVSEKPEIFNLARYQAKTQEWVTSLNQKIINVDEFDKELLPLLDGTNNINSITGLLQGKYLEEENLGKKISDKIEFYSTQALLAK